jgi:hypothetical protein
MFTNATRTADESASVIILGIRFVVFATKKFLSEPLYMEYKFAVSGHATANVISTLTQIDSDAAVVLRVPLLCSDGTTMHVSEVQELSNRCRSRVTPIKKLRVIEGKFRACDHSVDSTEPVISSGH